MLVATEYRGGRCASGDLEEQEKRAGGKEEREALGGPLLFTFYREVEPGYIPTDQYDHTEKSWARDLLMLIGNSSGSDRKAIRTDPFERPKNLEPYREHKGAPVVVRGHVQAIKRRRSHPGLLGGGSELWRASRRLLFQAGIASRRIARISSACSSAGGCAPDLEQYLRKETSGSVSIGVKERRSFGARFGGSLAAHSSQLSPSRRSIEKQTDWMASHDNTGDFRMGVEAGVEVKSEV
jgi:hypothetical protein